MEWWYETLKEGCIHVKTPLSLKDTWWLVTEFVDYYNTVQLHSAIAYITAMDKLAVCAEAIWAARKQKLTMAAAKRRANDKKMYCPERSGIN
jgi:hypothetical protein